MIDVFLFSTNLYLDVGFLEMVNLSDLFLVFFYEEGFEMKKMKDIGMKSCDATTEKFLFFTFLFLILTGIMVNRRYEKKKEVKFGNGTGSPLSDHYFLSACSEINSHFNQKEESTETSIVSSLPFYSVSKF